MPRPSVLRYLGWAKETTFGTPLAPASFSPVETMDWTPHVTRILDQGKRGVSAADFNVYQGHRFSEFSLGGNFYSDFGPTFLAAVHGTDTVTGTSPYTHSLALNNTPTRSYTVYVDYNANRRLIPGCLCEEFELSWGTTETSPLKYGAKLRGLLGATTTQTAATISAAQPFIGVSTTATIGGVAVARALSGKITWRRPTELIWGAGNVQDPSSFVQGPLEVTGSIRFYMDDDTELNHVLNMDKPALQLQFTQGTNTFTWLSTLTDFDSGKPDYGQQYVSVETTFRAFYNTTDAGVGKATMVNTTSAPYV